MLVDLDCWSFATRPWQWEWPPGLDWIVQVLAEWWCHGSFHRPFDEAQPVDCEVGWSHVESLDPVALAGSQLWMSSAICCAAYLVLADEHFAAACTVGQYPLPTERSLVTDTDLAAYACQGKRFTGLVEKTSTGHVARAEAEMGTSDGAVAILSDRRHCKSNRQEGLGVDGIAIGDGAVGRYMLSLWPHYRVACGFPAQSGSVITLAEVVADTDDHNRTIIAKLRPGLHDDFLLSQSLVDADKGFGTYPMTWSELIRTTQGRPFRLIPRCVIVQPSGKKRIIDDAAVGGQSELSSDYNKLVLCSALRLAQHAGGLQVGCPGVTGNITWPQITLKVEARIGQMLTDTVQSPGRRVSAASWFGGITDGNNRLSNSTTPCCLVYLWQLRVSTVTRGLWRHWDVVSLHALCPCISMMQM